MTDREESGMAQTDGRGGPLRRRPTRAGAYIIRAAESYSEKVECHGDGTPLPEERVAP